MFELVRRESCSYLCAADVPFEHGFLGTSFDFSTKRAEDESGRFCAFFGVPTLILISQYHGADALDLRQASEAPMERQPADAILVDRRNRALADCAFGIRTADCVPIILSAGHEIALIHAGWRGLANGIVQNCIASLTTSAQVALIGPCADANRYEVGDEVLAAIGTSAVFKKNSDGKSLLDLAATATAQIRSACPNAKILTSPYSTISSPEFHSHRGAGGAAGRNLAFVVARAG